MEGQRGQRGQRGSAHGGAARYEVRNFLLIGPLILPNLYVTNYEVLRTYVGICN